MHAADAREKLRQPINDQIFFAGEACAEYWASQVYGAQETGTDAAKQVISVLEKSKKPVEEIGANPTMQPTLPPANHVSAPCIPMIGTGLGKSATASAECGFGTP